MSIRTAREVAERVIVMATLASRASLEVTDHPRSDEISERLLGWLEQYDLAGTLDPIEREILATPRGTLTTSQRIDATLAEEGACFFAWCISRGPPLALKERADARQLASSFRILHTDVRDTVGSAALRPEPEIVCGCVDILLTLSELRQRRLADDSARKLLAELEMRRIVELGLHVSPESEECCHDFVDSLSINEQRAIAGIQFVRGEAARWLFDGRARYFQDDDRFC